MILNVQLIVQSPKIYRKMFLQDDFKCHSIKAQLCSSIKFSDALKNDEKLLCLIKIFFFAKREIDQQRLSQSAL